MKPCIRQIVLVLLVSLTAHAALAQFPADKAQQLIRDSGDSLLVIKGSIKYSSRKGSDVRDMNINCLGTVIDASGLVLAAQAPASNELTYLEQRVQFIMPDRSEVPARIVYQDDDLHLTVFAPDLKPEDPRPTFKPLALSAGADADIFTDVLALSRLDSDHRYRLAADTGRIICRITQPRTMYLSNIHLPGHFVAGIPVLLADGRVLGITAIKVSKSNGSIFILPAADILNLRKQASNALTQPTTRPANSGR